MFRELIIRGTSFDPDGSVAVEYCAPAIDGRLQGVVVNHTVFVDAGGQYDDEIQAVIDAVTALVTDVLEDLVGVEDRPVDSFVDGDDEEGDS